MLIQKPAFIFFYITMNGREWIWYNLTSSDSSGSLSGSGNTALIVLSTKNVYFVSSLILGASKIQAKACTWRPPLSWNSIHNVQYFVLPKDPSKTISLKKMYFLYWKSLAKRILLFLRSSVCCWYFKTFFPHQSNWYWLMYYDR